jgi:hypothetical protein
MIFIFTSNVCDNTMPGNKGKFGTRHCEKGNAYRYEHFDSEMPCGFLGFLVSVPPNTLQILWEVFTSVGKMKSAIYLIWLL